MRQSSICIRQSSLDCNKLHNNETLSVLKVVIFKFHETGTSIVAFMILGKTPLKQMKPYVISLF